MLAGASDNYFAPMFQHDMKEKKQKEIRVGNMDGETLKSLVDYCHSGQIKITAENVLKVLAASNMTGFQLIMSECEKHLTVQLVAKPNSCLNIYKIAYDYSLVTLMEKSYEMIGKQFRGVAKKNVFCEMEYPMLELILQSDNKIYAKEEEIFEAAMKWVKHDEGERKQFIRNILKSIYLVHIDPLVTL